jgi:hypothetical protein
MTPGTGCGIVKGWRSEMAISNTYVTVACDCHGCRSNEEVELPFVYSGPMHTLGHYDHCDEFIEKKIRRMEWVIRNGKHFCSLDCLEMHISRSAAMHSIVED